MVETDPVAVGHPEAGRAIEHEVLTALVPCLMKASPPGRQCVPLQHGLSMARLEEILAEEPCEPLPIRQLCRRLELSEWALNARCIAFLGVGPVRYLRLRRLKLIRAAMLGDAFPTATVSEIANRYGFSETRPFVASYRLAFGESPTETLGRVRNLTS